MKIKTEISVIIKELRLKKGWSQDELAERLGMNRVNISNYERGIIKSIPSSTLKKLADVFDVSSDYLLGQSEDYSKPKSEFLNRMELSEDDLLNQYMLVLDGEIVSDDERRYIVSFLRTVRSMR